MSDNFMDLLSGEGPDKKGQGDRGMEDLLGSLLGGGGGGGAALGSLLGGLMGGGGAQQGGGADDMAGMLGSLLGGGGGAQQGGGADDMAGMLGSLMGGGGAQQGGAGGLLGGLLGGLMGGGGGGNAGQMSFGGGGGGVSLPFAGTLAEKLGISELMANMLIMGAIGLLTSSMAKNRSGGSIDVNGLTDPDYIRSSGVAGRLSNQMGISEDDAILGLQQTMGMMMAEQGHKPAAKPKSSATKKKASTGGSAPKKSSSTSTKTTAKIKTTKKNSGSDFMDLLDDPKD